MDRHNLMMCRSRATSLEKQQPATVRTGSEHLANCIPDVFGKRNKLSRRISRPRNGCAGMLEV
jgi:hypothetical protein